ncbi:hypothetical protein EV363DRAFT_1297589 [Boletus edulis]|nr:hypothetical protein EV363DRAFT_1297589 [Boletus edulis]
MHNSATAFFTAQDKQRHPYLSSVLEPSTQKVIATAAVRVYYAPFINAHLNWTYSNLRGILVFGRDREAGNPPPGRGMGTHGLRLKERYWFRLVDIKTDRVVWMFSVPEVFEYNKDKPFFHYFSGTTRMFGFCFDDDGEAAVFFKKVVDRTRRHSVFRPFCTNSAKKDKENTKTPPTAKFKSIKANLISGPAPHSFVHVSHVGVNTRGIIESSKNIEPAWGAMIADLQGYGISPELMGNNMGFIKELVTGVPSELKTASAFAMYVSSPVPPPTPVTPLPDTKRKIRRKVMIL